MQTKCTKSCGSASKWRTQALPSSSGATAAASPAGASRRRRWPVASCGGSLGCIACGHRQLRPWVLRRYASRSSSRSGLW